MLGASQIKVMAGGGVASPFDPIDVTQYTEPEIRVRGRCRRELGDLRDGPRLHAPGDHPGDPGLVSAASNTVT